MRVLISCGEPSGDLYAGALAREILSRDPSATITGFGSERLRAGGASLVADFEGLSVTGLLEVARVLPRTYAVYRQLVAHAAETRPDVFVAIDYPDFNFRLAHAMAEALSLASRIGVLADGVLVALDTPARIAASTDSQVRALLAPLVEASAALKGEGHA